MRPSYTMCPQENGGLFGAICGRSTLLTLAVVASGSIGCGVYNAAQTLDAPDAVSTGSSDVETGTLDEPTIPGLARRLDLSRVPTTAQLVASGLSSGPLSPSCALGLTSEALTEIPTMGPGKGDQKVVESSCHEALRHRGGAVSGSAKGRASAIALSFGAAMQAWNDLRVDDARELFEKHVQQFNDSPWSGEALLHLSDATRARGDIKRSEDLLVTLLDRLTAAKNASKNYQLGSGAALLRDKALLRVAMQRAREGALQPAIQLLEQVRIDSSSWRLRTYATQWMRRMAEAWRDGGGEGSWVGIDGRDPGPSLPPLGGGGDNRYADASGPDPFGPRGDSGGDGNSPDTGDPGEDGGPDHPDEETHESEEEDPCGAPVWSINMVNMNMVVVDVPLWYATPYGPSVEMVVTYNAQSTASGYLPMGPKWQLGYASYIVQDDSDTVFVHMPDGSVGTYSWNGAGEYRSDSIVPAKLRRLNAVAFELIFRSGEKWTYSVPNGGPVAMPVLESIRNARGHELIIHSVIEGDAVRIAFVRDAQGKESRFEYNAQGLISHIYDPFGRMASFDYENGRLKSIQDMGGYMAEFGYAPEHSVTPPPYSMTSISNEIGTWQFFEEPSDGADLSGASLRYPAPGAAMGYSYRVTVTDPGGKKSEYFYSFGHEASWYVSPSQYVEYEDSQTNNDRTAPKMRYSLKTRGDSNGILDLGSEIEEIVYPAGETVTFEYDEGTGRLTSRTGPPPGQSYTYEYNRKGRLEKIVSKRGTDVSYWYHDNGVDIRTVYAAGTRLGFEYNDYHQVTKITDADGGETVIGYNANRQPESRTDPSGRSMRIEYGDNNWPSFVYVGDAIVMRVVERDAVGRVRRAIDAMGAETVLTYTDLNYVKTVQRGDSPMRRFEYAGSCPGLLERVVEVSSTDDAERTLVTIDYDPHQRVSGVTRPGGWSAELDYDANSNIGRISDFGRRQTSLHYDVADRLVERQFADGTSESFWYNDIGYLAGYADARGQVTRYSYDTAGFLVRVTHEGGLGGQAVTPGAQLERDAYGRVERIQKLPGRRRWPVVNTTRVLAYDRQNRLASASGELEDSDVAYTYDEDGRLETISVGGNEYTRYAYDSLGRLQLVTAPWGTFRYDYACTNWRPRNLHRPAAMPSTGYWYDTTGRLRAIRHASAGGGGDVDGTVVEYDASGLISRESRIRNIAVSTNALQERMAEHNLLNQIVRASDVADELAYDAAGNLLFWSTPDGGHVTAQYDARSRLTRVERHDASGDPLVREYIYSVDGLLSRIETWQAGQLTDAVNIVRSGMLPVQERNDNNEIMREYVWGQGGPGGIGALLSMRDSNGTYAFLYDNRGNVLSVVNQHGQVVAEYAYGPHGEMLHESGTLEQPFRYSSKRYDAAMGTYYYGFRFYSPTFRRWLNRDPIREAGGINLYGFVGNDPINYFDPWGLMKLPPDPSGLGSDWAHDPSHRYPNGERYRHPSGDILDFHKGEEGKHRWGGRDHWHHNKGKKHLRPGDEVPDPNPICQERSDLIDLPDPLPPPYPWNEGNLPPLFPFLPLPLGPPPMLPMPVPTPVPIPI